LLSNFAFAGVSGTIFYRNGDSLKFEQLGTKEKVYDGIIDGKFNNQKVTYKFEEVKEIYFSHHMHHYRNYTDAPYGAMIIVNKADQRLRLVSCRVIGGSSGTNEEQTYWGSIRFVYKDPETKELKEKTDKIQNNISHIFIE
jgi:hypothetical protein